MPSREWREGRVEISREQFGTIIAKEMADVVTIARSLGDKALADFIKEMLTEFSANVAVEVFKSLDEQEETE